MTETDPLDTMHNLGSLLYDQGGALVEAESLLTEAFQRRRIISGALHIETIRVMGSLGRVLTAQGRFDEAERYLVPAREWRGRQMPDHPDAILGEVDWALLLRARGDVVEARKLIEAAHAHLMQRFGPDDFRTKRVASVLADL